MQSYKQIAYNFNYRDIYIMLMESIFIDNFHITELTSSFYIKVSIR